MCSIMPPRGHQASDFRGEAAFGRRAWLAGGVVAGVALAGRGARGAGKEKEEGEDVGPGEDLMREHGVLRRVLIVYRELMRRLDAGAAGTDSFDPDLLRRATKLIRKFVEDYHERQEEELIFPRFEKAKKLTELVRVLRVQHDAGRKVTDRTT